MFIRTTASAIIALLAAAPALAAAPSYNVPANCASPSTTYNNQYYVDPINGSDTGNGSQAKPWKTLQTVIAKGLIASPSYKLPYAPGSAVLPAPKTGIVKPGDIIWLASGNHGVAMLENVVNPDFITIKALPGAVPTFTAFTILGGSHWVVDGVTVEATNATATPDSLFLVKLNANSYWGPLDNVVFTNSNLKSVNDVSSWQPSDWRALHANGIYLNGNPGSLMPDGSHDLNGVNDGQCFSITQNTISNIGFGINATLSDKVLVQGNTIDHFSNDGIDYGSSDMVIDGNIITNSIDDGDGLHRDAMQGQPYWGETTYNHDVTISNNVVIAQTMPMTNGASLQGIDTFDGLWNNIHAYNNIILSNAYHGLIFYGANNVLIENNTVLSTSSPVTATLQPGALAGSADQTAGPNSDAMLTSGALWIGVNNSKAGAPASNVVIRNNIASSYLLVAPAITFNGNFVAGTNTKMWIPIPPGGNKPSFAAPGDLFVAFDPATYNYDLHVKAGSPFVGIGATPVSN